VKGGTGLGLSIAQRIVEMHGGRSVESKIGRGATFFVTVPVTVEQQWDTHDEAHTRGRGSEDNQQILRDLLDNAGSR
jgi:hypothetical protein